MASPDEKASALRAVARTTIEIHPMRYLYLDVDQVLNTRLGSLDEDKLELLQYIVGQTGCRLILSSTWRKSGLKKKQLEEALAVRGMRLSGETPDLSATVDASVLIVSVPRRDEIRQHMREHVMSWDTWAIVDDDTGADIGDGSYVQTFKGIGMQQHHADRIITILTNVKDRRAQESSNRG